jgi:hypothetical protein
MTVLLRNNATSVLASSMSTGITTMSVTAGDGGKFPAPGAGQWFPVTVVKSTGVLEVMRCTARTGDVLTVMRAQEGTAAQAFSAGDRVELRITNQAMGEFGQLTSVQSWTGLQTFSVGMQSLGNVSLLGSVSDSPRLRFANSGRSINVDLSGALFRVFSDDSLPVVYPIIADLASKTFYVFENPVWHSGNFNPADYLPANAKAADSNLLDGLDSTSFLRKSVSNSATGTQLTSPSPPSIAVASASQPALTINNEGNGSASAIIDFRREGVFAAFFGIDTDNQFKVGGGSFGAVSYAIWHDGNADSRAIQAQAQAGVGGVGSYAFMRNITGGTLGVGVLVSGSSLRYTDTTQSGGAGASGTWRCMGECVNGAGSLFLRIS